MSIFRMIAAVSLTMLVSEALPAQSIASRIAAVRDGKVRMTFASRDSICGFHNGISTGKNTRNTWSPRVSEDVEYDVECSEGPARIVAQMSGGRLVGLKAYVGGRWRPAAGVTDIGAVSVREATSWLLGLAATGSDKVASHAIFASTLADSVNIARPLYDFARNASHPEETRGHAIFWLGQTRTSESTQYLRSLYSGLAPEDLKDKVIFSLSQQRGVNDDWLLDLVANRNESIEMRKKALFWAGQTGASMAQLSQLYSRMNEKEMKEQMVFVFSQKREPAAVDKLMDIAKNDPDRETRRKALFWLGQSRDPRVAAMLSDMINREE